MTILELREKRAKAWEAAKAFLDSHRNDKGILSAEDDAAYTRMEQEITDLGKEIARLERQEALDAELNRPVNKPLTGKPMNGKEENKTGRATDAASAAGDQSLLWPQPYQHYPLHQNYGADGQLSDGEVCVVGLRACNAGQSGQP